MIQNSRSRCTLKLLPRNEGKIKSHESCVDFRAWSHDQYIRTRYLKEWMKSDMLPCVPLRSLTAISRTMTMSSRRRVPPRCHPECKSKVILESIAASCQAIKECMNNDANFNEYFEEEEFETSHWPCNRCLEALKTIKIFWKFLMRKVFNVTVSKEDTDNCQRKDSVKSLVKSWQEEILCQAAYVKSVNGTNKSVRIHKESHSWNDIRINYKRTGPVNDRPCKTEADQVCKGDMSTNKVAALDKKHAKTKRKKTSRSTTAKVKNVEAGCLCNLSKKRNDSELYKSNLERWKQQTCKQKSEIERLQRENNSLREELDGVYKTFTWKAYYNPESNNKFSVCLVPKEKESVTGSVVDSETVITMKECSHKHFRHVALLQILRKTNNPITEELSTNICNDNPVDILTKVQNTFDAIVRNEINIASEKKRHSKRSTIDASSRRMTSSKSAPSFTTIKSSLSDFMSASGHNH